MKKGHYTSIIHLTTLSVAQLGIFEGSGLIHKMAYPFKRLLHVIIFSDFETEETLQEFRDFVTFKFNNEMMIKSRPYK